MIQAQIINLLERLQGQLGLTYLFIAHDLSVVRHISDRIAVMYLGRIVEVAPSRELNAKPLHPYTVALLAAIPEPDPEIRPDPDKILGGELPSPMNPPSGCRFRTRCPKAQDICAEQEPEVREFRPGQFVACHFPVEPGEELEFASVPHH